MKHLHTLWLTVVLATTSTLLYAQTGTVKGRITDENGEGLTAAAIFIEGTNLGTIADLSGDYQLDRVPAGRQTIAVSFIGYAGQQQTIDVPAGGTAEFNAQLEPDLMELQNVVVSGSFNPASNLESSIAISTLNSAKLEEVFTGQGNADYYLGVPGLMVTKTQDNIDIVVRGLPGRSNVIQFQEDGLPIMNFNPAWNLRPEHLLFNDLSLNRVEVIRGGSSAVFASSAPGALINHISKTGGPRFSGTARMLYASQGAPRVDVEFGGPLSDKWRYHVGGFYRYDGDGLLNYEDWTFAKGGSLKPTLHAC